MTNAQLSENVDQTAAIQLFLQILRTEIKVIIAFSIYGGAYRISDQDVNVTLAMFVNCLHIIVCF